uniref:Uncharacterized protein n=1 Tax=Rhizophora mucronata TaxID=61149 RepID=A0A2P2PDD3_RHIMU
MKNIDHPIKFEVRLRTYFESLDAASLFVSLVRPMCTL